jgi:pimeloyl-ACP methyl ester carboxylesterase
MQAPQATPGNGCPGILHRYTKTLVAFEHTPKPNDSTPENTILFIGGLGDGLLTVDYTKAIAKALPSHWSLVEVLISSSYEGWRTGDLTRDADEIELCVLYFRSLRPKDGKIVLMGHSTGCQDIMEYHVGKLMNRDIRRSPVDGIILQGAVSDREDAEYYHAREGSLLEFAQISKFAKKMFTKLDGVDVIPERIYEHYDRYKMSAYRFLSLYAKSGDDDYFSSDLSDDKLQTTFGRLLARTGIVMVILGERDQHVPPFVNKRHLLSRWKEAANKYGNVKFLPVILPGASHNLNGDPPEVVERLVKVILFITEDGGTLPEGFNLD